MHSLSSENGKVGRILIRRRNFSTDLGPSYYLEEELSKREPGGSAGIVGMQSNSRLVCDDAHRAPAYVRWALSPTPSRRNIPTGTACLPFLRVFEPWPGCLVRVSATTISPSSVFTKPGSWSSLVPKHAAATGLTKLTREAISKPLILVVVVVVVVVVVAVVRCSQSILNCELVDCEGVCVTKPKNAY